MFGNLTNAEIESVLRRQTLLRLGCCSGNEVYVVPISYAYDGEFVYIYTTEGKKTNMMRKNPKVCIQADEMNSMSEWKSVICWGDARELIVADERSIAIESLAKRKLPMMASETTQLFQGWPFHSDDFDQLDGILFSIKIIEKTGRFEKRIANNADSL